MKAAVSAAARHCACFVQFYFRRRHAAGKQLVYYIAPFEEQQRSGVRIYNSSVPEGIK